MSKEKRQGGCPLLAEQVEIQHEKAYVRMQKQMAKNTTKASDIITWLLMDIHDSVNPNNKGKKDDKGKDIYNPLKYKENTQLSVAKEFIANSKEYNKAKEELAKAQKASGNLVAEDEDEDYTPVLSLTSEPSSKTLN